MRVYITSREVLKESDINIMLFNEKKELVLCQHSKTDKGIFPPISGKAYVDFSIQEIPFAAGIYSLSVKLTEGHILNCIDYHINIKSFKVKSGSKLNYGASLYLNGKWEIFNG